MNIIKAWKESIFGLKPENLKMLLLVTLNMLRRELIFVITIFCLLFLFYFRVIPGQASVLFFYLPLVFALFLRPSIKRKSLEYVWDKKWHFFYWFLLHIFTIALVYFLFVHILHNLFIGNLKLYMLFIVYLFRTIIFFSLSILTALFWLDSQVTFKNLALSFWRAIKMFIFNFPVYLIFFALLFLLDWLFTITLFFSSYLYMFMFLILFIFYICLQVNFYIKNIHENFGLYFKE